MVRLNKGLYRCVDRAVRHLHHGICNEDAEAVQILTLGIVKNVDTRLPTRLGKYCWINRKTTHLAGGGSDLKSRSCANDVGVRRRLGEKGSSFGEVEEAGRISAKRLGDVIRRFASGRANG
jgi:hypothetical protein